MLRSSALLIALVCLSACKKESNPTAAPVLAPAASAGLFGDPLTPGQALEVSSVLAAAANHEQQEILLSGRVAKVCPSSGCWLELEGNPSNLTLVFETAAGQQYTVPKELAGKSILAKGRLERVGGELQLVARGLAVQP